MSVFSSSGSAAKPSAYSCTTAASSTRSSRYFCGRRGAAAGRVGRVSAAAPFGCRSPECALCRLHRSTSGCSRAHVSNSGCKFELPVLRYRSLTSSALTTARRSPDAPASLSSSRARLDRRAQAPPCASGSPWTMKVSRGGRVKPPSQRMISTESACADIESIDSIVRVHGITSAVDLDRSSRRPRACGRGCRPPGNRRSSTVLRASGSAGRQVVQHAPAGRHAARGNDDRGHSSTASAASTRRRSKSCGSARCRTR